VEPDPQRSGTFGRIQIRIRKWTSTITNPHKN
jgi:hypothetical protein